MTMNRQHKLTHWLLLCLAALWLGSATAEISAGAQADAERLDKIFERSSLKIATPDARMHSFDVWLAADDQRRQRGLMYVRQLDPKAGMLFVYPAPFKIGMWMMNTYISLDMLFVNAKGRVVQIVERTTPESLETISASTEVLGVIELSAGTVERLKIRPGARVMHPAFGTATE
jgi:uncharacterized membrane protein (UPF0127 family)